eukprot:6587752-Alexandrium_andersonii.AAC.1
MAPATRAQRAHTPSEEPSEGAQEGTRARGVVNIGGEGVARSRSPLRGRRLSCPAGGGVELCPCLAGGSSGG